MKISGFLLILLSVSLLITSCQKELNFADVLGNSVGTLKSDVTGDCLGSTVTGLYKEDSLLGTGNYIDVQVDITAAGHYVIASDTVNGFSFRGEGTVGTLGTQPIRLYASGKPVTEGTSTFVIQYDTTICFIDVDVISGGPSAVYTLDGSPGNCNGAVTNGTYVAGTAMGSANTVTLFVNVTTAGAYNVTTMAVNGISFSGSGTLTASASPQPITLTASGIPAASGTFNFTAAGGGTDCVFSVNVTGAVDFLRAKINGVLSDFSMSATATLDNSTGANILSIIGNSGGTPDSTINLYVSNNSGGSINAGTYNVNMYAAGFSVAAQFFDSMGTEFDASTDPANQSQTPAFTIVITNITPTRVTGTFTGPVKDNLGAGPGVVNITEGAFDLPL
jgi:hypothetical protein